MSDEITTVLYDPNAPVLVPKLLHDQMVKDQRLLRALVAAGVDNWDGYDYAMEIAGEDDPDAETAEDIYG